MFILINVCQISFAQSFEDKRRVEEGKRKDLFPSEQYLSETKEASPPEDDFSLNQYFSKLLAVEVATYSDAYKSLVVLLGVEGQYNDTGSQFRYLRETGIIPKNIGTQENYDEPLRKGALAYMFVKAMGIKGGITLRIFGTTQRYALKELVYQEIMFPGIVHDFISGQELIWTLTQAADYMGNKQTESKRQ